MPPNKFFWSVSTAGFISMMLQKKHLFVVKVGSINILEISIALSIKSVNKPDQLTQKAHRSLEHYVYPGKYEMKYALRYLIICLAVVTNQEAFSCSSEIVEKYVSKVSYYLPKHFCRGETKFLKIDINTQANTKEEKFSGISLVVKDSNGNIITRYRLPKSSPSNGLWLSACITESYLKSTEIEFYIMQEKEVIENKNGTYTHTLSVKSKTESCNLYEFIKNI
jgi:hypothetical protein